MLSDVLRIRRVILCCGYVDMRKGIDGLAQIVGSRFDLNPFEKGTMFLFCGRRTDRHKALLWMGDGFISCIGVSRMAVCHGRKHRSRLRSLRKSSIIFSCKDLIRFR